MSTDPVMIRQTTIACFTLVLAMALTGASAWASPPTPWPDGVVYFEFDPAANYSNSEKEHVRRGMDAWSQTDVDVVFLPRNGLAGVPYVRIAKEGGNNAAPIGKPTSSSLLNLNSVGLNGAWFPAHEIGHVLGFHHEQSRPDRDDFVQLNTSNMDDPNDSNYDIVAEADFIYDINLRGFNYNSIMLYSQCFNSNCDGAFADCPNELECAPAGGRTMIYADGTWTAFATEWGPGAFSDNDEELYQVDINRGVDVYGSGKVRYLDKNSSDASKGTLEKPYTTLSDAADNSPSGSRVYVDGGGDDYTGTPITLDRNLTWRAYPNTTVVIR